MSYKLLTNLLFEPRGKHNPSLTYNIKDTVMSEDGSKVYFALDNVPAGIPLTDTNYWMLQMDLSASKNAMDVAAANARTQTDATIASANTRVEDMMGKAAEAVTSVADYATKLGMRVKGETRITKGNPMTIYPDGGSLLKVQTDIPIKQLGEGDPYPAGAGKNLLPYPYPTKGTNINGITLNYLGDGRVSFKGTANENFAFILHNYVAGMRKELPAGTYTISGNPAANFIIYLYVYDSQTVESETAVYSAIGGSSSTFTINKTMYYGCYAWITSGTVLDTIIAPQLEKGSTPTSYTPYANIRPFVGYDELELRHAGKNLCNISPFLSAWATENTATLSLINTLAPGTYTISVVFEMQNPERASATDKCGLFFYPYGERVFVEWGSVAVSTTRRVTCTFNITADNAGKFTAAYFYGCGADGIGYTGYATAKDVQIEFGSTATPYEPYKGTLHTVQLGKNTYQGHYDWLSGKFRSEFNVQTFYGTEDWILSPELKIMVLFTPDGEKPVSDFGSDAYMSHFKKTSTPVLAAMEVNEFIFSSASMSTDSTLSVRTDMGLDEWKAYLAAQSAAGTPVQFAYKLATPIEIPLAPNVITSVEDGGVNHIYGDADLTVEWVKPLETSLTEHSNAKVDANNEALLMDVAQKERSVGNPVVINDAVANVAFPHVETVFTPKQAGSGDPYPAGGGRNLLPPCPAFSRESNGITITSDGNGKYSMKGTAAGTMSVVVDLERQVALGDVVVVHCMNNVSTDAASISYYRPDGTQITWTTLNVVNRIQNNPTLPNETVAKFGFYVADGRTVDIEYTPMILIDETPTAFQPYSNIRPITGYDKLELNHTGKNLFTGWIRGGRINSIMGAFEITSDAARTGYIPVVPSKQIEISGLTDTLYNFVAFYDEAKNFVSRSNAVALNAVTIRTPDNCAYIAITQYENVNVTGTITGLKDTVQIEYGTSVTEYTPHAGMDTYTVQIGQTVYGGRYNWLTGKLMVEFGCAAFDGSEPWQTTDWHNQHTYALWNFLPDIVDYGQAEIPDAYCSHFAANSVNVLFYNNVSGFTSFANGAIICSSIAHVSVDEFKSYLAAQKAAGTPVQIAYKLATPIEIQLDPTRITTIPGTNTIFGDGEFTIDWFKSYKKVAEERENLLLDSFTDKAELSGNPIVMSPVGGISFDSVVTKFTPKQSGSGNPYPYLGGKNIFPPWHEDSFEMSGVTFTKQADGSIRARGTPTTHAYITLTDYKTLRAHGFSDGPYTIHGLPAESDAWFVDLIGDANTQNINFYQNGVVNFTEEVNKNGTYAWRIVITPNMGAVDLVFKIQIEAGSTATEYAPPENIRPISGWDKLNLGAAGKNLFNLNQTYDYFVGNIITGDVITTTFSSNGALHIKEGDIHPAGVYTLTIVPVSGFEGFEGWLYYADNDEEKRISPFNASNLTATIVADRPFKIGFGGIYRHPEHTCSYKVQLEVGSDSTAYEPYQGTLHTVQIGQTVYGGKFDWLTGKFRAEWARVEFVFDGNFLPWTANNGSTDTLFYLPTSFHNDIPTAKMGGRCICSHAKTVDEPPVNQIGCQVSAGTDIGIIYLNLGVQTGAYGFNQYVAENGVQIAYELAEPYIIQLPPAEIIALTGVNTLYGDGDTITAKFRQSKDVDILKRLSALETLMTNQTKGE